MPTSPAAPPRPPFPFLLATSAICGALVMAIEVLGSRVVGPWFGVSLFVWTSLITVTLVALAGGYAIGGWLSDRRPSADWLYAIVGVAGLLVLAVPRSREPLLHACLPLGVRAGALVSAAALFGPSLFLLGCVSPYVVKIAAGELGRIGRTVGALSALSTAGSFAGTVLTGFVLVARFGIGAIFHAIGATLVVLAVIWFVAFRRRLAAAGALLLVAAAGAPAPALRAAVLPDGTRVTERFARDGFYSQLRVVDFEGPAGRRRELLLDGQVQGGMDLATGLSVHPFAVALELLPVALAPGGERCLVVGLGAGLVPRWYEAAGVTTDVVELDPEVIRVARDLFDLRIRGEAVADDARHFLNVTSRRYDYVVLDVFAGDTTPGHVLSVEALRLARAAMTPRGVLAVNLIGRTGPDGIVVASVVRTMREVFDTVEVHPVQGGITNVAAVAYRGPRRRWDRAAAERLPVHPDLRGELGFLWRTYEFPPETPAFVLTDDWQPTDALDLELKEAIREGINARRAGWDAG